MTYTFRSMLLLLTVLIVVSGVSGCAAKSQNSSQGTAQEALRGTGQPVPTTPENQAKANAISAAFAAKSASAGASSAAAAAAAKQAPAQHH